MAFFACCGGGPSLRSSADDAEQLQLGRHLGEDINAQHSRVSNDQASTSNLTPVRPFNKWSVHGSVTEREGSRLGRPAIGGGKKRSATNKVQPFSGSPDDGPETPDGGPAGLVGPNSSPGGIPMHASGGGPPRRGMVPAAADAMDSQDSIIGGAAPGGGRGDSMVTSGEELYAMGFKLYSADNFEARKSSGSASSSSQQAVAFIALDLVRSPTQGRDHRGMEDADGMGSNDLRPRLEYEHSSNGLQGGKQRSTAAASPGGRNRLVPVFANQFCLSYFKIDTAGGYVSVVRKLLKRDPLLTFALQKAVRHLKAGDGTCVTHVTPDPSGQTSALYGMRISPCVWRTRDGRVLPALMMEHNVAYNPAEIMPRLMRDYAVLSHVPAILTLIDFQGKVLYQNASSLEYMGDLLSAKYDYKLADGLLNVLFTYDLHSLEQMLENVLRGSEWQGVVQVPYSLRQHLGVQQDSDTIIDFNKSMNGPEANPGAMVAKEDSCYSQDPEGGGRAEDDDDFQIGDTRAAARKRQSVAFMLKQQSSVYGSSANGSGDFSSSPGRREASMSQHPPREDSFLAALAPPGAVASTSSAVEPRRHQTEGSIGASASASRAGGSVSFTDRIAEGGGTPHGHASMTSAGGGSSSALAAAAGMAPGMPQRRFMSLIDKAPTAREKGGQSMSSRGPSMEHIKGGASGIDQMSLTQPIAEESSSKSLRKGHSLAGVAEDGSQRGGNGQEGQEEEGEYDGEDEEDEEGFECYHEVHAIPLLDPVLDKQVIMLVQTDVTPRVELENKLADLTDAQLSMLEQLFPRHIIEYMLARVPSKVSRNLRGLANTHEQVMVLFCDVVGFTSMSKEVEPSQVMHFLNELYECFDELVDDYGMYKLDIVGDCYIVVAGLIKEDQDGFVCVDELDEDQIASNAVRIMQFAKAMLRHSQPVLMPHNSEPVSLRIGIHTGPLVSGLVGAKMPKFTLFGDTMNTASRMESTCRPGCIQVSDAFASLVAHEDWEATGGVQVKGKGMMETFLHVPNSKRQELITLEPDAAVKTLRKTLVEKSFTSGNSRGASSVARSRNDSENGQAHNNNNNALMTILSNIRGGGEGGGGGDDARSSAGAPAGTSGGDPSSVGGTTMGRHLRPKSAISRKTLGGPRPSVQAIDAHGHHTTGASGADVQDFLPPALVDARRSNAEPHDVRRSSNIHNIFNIAQASRTPTTRNSDGTVNRSSTGRAPSNGSLPRINSGEGGGGGGGAGTQPGRGARSNRASNANGLGGLSEAAARLASELLDSVPGAPRGGRRRSSKDAMSSRGDRSSKTSKEGRSSNARSSTGRSGPSAVSYRSGSSFHRALQSITSMHEREFEDAEYQEEDEEGRGGDHGGGRPPLAPPPPRVRRQRHHAPGGGHDGGAIGTGVDLDGNEVLLVG